MLRAVVAAALIAEPAFADAPTFLPVAVLPHVYDGGWEHFVGGGVAVFDCDGDDLPEVFAAGGENNSVLFLNTSTQGGVVDLQPQAPESLALTGVIGAYPIDIDNDAVTDLVVLRVGPNVILKGGKDCSFSEMTEFGIDLGDAWTTAFSATWGKGSALPTLAFGNYVDRNDPKGPFEACDANVLLRPDGNGYAAPEELSPNYCPLSMLFSDWQRTGERDLRVSNDRHYYVKNGQEQLWSIADKPRLFGANDGWIDHKLWGMGIASRDVTGDGVPEVMMTSMGDQRLQMRDTQIGKAAFVDVPFTWGTTAHRPYAGGDGRPSTGWHVEFGDMQNDGRDDIFIAKGNVEQMPGLAMKDPNNLLVQHEGGVFKEAGAQAGLASFHRGRGAALSDLNGDGLLDVVVVNRRAPMEVYRNTTKGAGNWIGVQLHQDGFNRNAVGAWLALDTGGFEQSREITVGGGHAGGQLGPSHFGLGDLTDVELRVTWADGRVSRKITLEAGRLYHLDRVGDDVVIRD